MVEERKDINEDRRDIFNYFKHKDFYDEWVKIYQNSFAKIYQIPTPRSKIESILKLSERSAQISRGYTKNFIISG